MQNNLRLQIVSPMAPRMSRTCLAWDHRDLKPRQAQECPGHAWLLSAWMKMKPHGPENVQDMPGLGLWGGMETSVVQRMSRICLAWAHRDGCWITRALRMSWLYLAWSSPPKNVQEVPGLGRWRQAYCWIMCTQTFSASTITAVAPFSWHRTLIV